MLAGVEEAVQRGAAMIGQMTGQASAIDSVLAGLIDYAGLYPPAGLDMRTTVGNYLAYKRSGLASALGRFIIDVHRIDELRVAAGDDLGDMRLSVIASARADMELISELIEAGLRIESVEFKTSSTGEIERLRPSPELEIYIEVPIGATAPALLELFAAAGFGVKVRMGGVVAGAFPSPAAVAEMLAALHRHGLAFKATAGLHHPLRSSHRLTCAADSPSGAMHGFVNLVCASTLIHFGGEAFEAAELLEEQDPSAFRLTPQGIAWRSRCWNAEELGETRKKFFRSFGSCSFEEPFRDLEELGWL
jgi:hypothetical protein